MNLKRSCLTLITGLIFVSLIVALAIGMSYLQKHCVNERNWWLITRIVFFVREHKRFPSNIVEFADYTYRGGKASFAKALNNAIRFSSVSVDCFVTNECDFVLFKNGDRQRQRYVNEWLRRRLTPQFQNYTPKPNNVGEVRGR